MRELEILLSSRFRDLVEQNLDRDPLAVALDRKVPNAALVASQVKYLRRAESKLPSWYSARCVLTGRAFEQSSGEAAALLKSYSGRTAIDLTCGLGVDSWALSRNFEQVITLEKDPELAAIARENLDRLGVRNILIINTSAEDFLRAEEVDFSRVDLIYADPDRRDSVGKKLVRMEDCSPDMVALLPEIRRKFSAWKRVDSSVALSATDDNNYDKYPPHSSLVVKLSPLFDIAEIFRVFGFEARAEVISLDGECKEVVAEIPLVNPSLSKRQTNNNPIIRAIAIGLGEVEYPFIDNPSHADYSVEPNPFEPDLYKFLVIPDVSLQKSRLARRYFSERGAWIDSDNGYAFSTEKPVDLMGKVIDIQSIEPFNPKELKRRIKAQKVKNVEILRHNFPLSTAELKRALGLKNGKSSGATLRICFTSASVGLWQITLG